MDRDAELAHLREEVRALRASTSWRLTAPLRAARRLLGGAAAPVAGPVVAPTPELQPKSALAAQATGAAASVHTADFTAHNVRLDDGSLTFPAAGATMDQMGDFVCVRNMLRALYPDGLAGRSIVDLGCLEGGFTAEFARLGLDSTGIEVRESNLKNARYIKEKLGLPNLHFHQDDAWNVGQYGPFDAVFCVGLYYHIEDARRFLQAMADACRKVIFIDTHFAPDEDDAPAVGAHGLSALTEHEGMRGRWYNEHDLDADKDAEHLEGLKWASWRNRRSFWPTKAALVDAMRKAGFAVVVEDFDALGGAMHALSKDSWHSQNSRWMLVGIKV